MEADSAGGNKGRRLSLGYIRNDNLLLQICDLKIYSFYLFFFSLIFLSPLLSLYTRKKNIRFIRSLMKRQFFPINLKITRRLQLYWLQRIGVGLVSKQST